MTFRVGQKVVFIGEGDGQCRLPLWERFLDYLYLLGTDKLKIGAIYVVSWHDFEAGTLGIVGNKTPRNKRFLFGYSADLFRPIVTTDISIFKAMLNTKPETVLAETGRQIIEALTPGGE